MEGGQGLSGGQKQLVAILGTFGEAKVILLDEPMASMDRVGRAPDEVAVKRDCQTGNGSFGYS